MRKKKRSRASKQGGVSDVSKQIGVLSKENSEEERVLKSLTEAFTSISIKEAAAAYKEANGDVNKAAEILEGMVESAEDRSTTSSRNEGPSSGSSSVSEEVFVEAGSAKNMVRQKGKGNGKRVVAGAGTVSIMLGKDYVRSVPKKSSMKSKDFNVECWRSKEDDEQFLYSMLGEDCELSMAVVRDVLCQCGYDVEKALNVLLEFSASSSEQSMNGDSKGNNKQDSPFFLESSDSLTDSTWDSTSHSSESEVHENVWYAGPPHRNHSKVFAGTEVYSSIQPGNSWAELPQSVLESLFNMPTPKNAEHEPNTMNWKKVVKKLASLGQKVESFPVNGRVDAHVDAKGDEYHVFRQAAKQNWESTRSYYQKAATAFSNGEREYAAHLSEQGRLHNKMAREADEKASQDIFIARNKSIENRITIDLHGQHVKQAMRLLKVHLVFGAYVQSVRLFRIITGCGSHGLGKSKLKCSVIDLLKKEGIKWSEENQGTLLVKLDGQTNFSFLDNDSDDE